MSKTDVPNNGNGETNPANGKKRLLQTDVPGYSLEQALRIPRAIAENYAYKPTKPFDVATALNMTPTSGSFRGISGAAMAYGLTTGGPNASEIGITPLGMKIVRPVEEGQDTQAKREALLKPRVFAEFLKKYDEAQLPKTDIARNVLVSMGVPVEKAAEVLELLLESADSVGFFRQIKDKRYVSLNEIILSSGSDSFTDDDSDLTPHEVVKNGKEEVKVSNSESSVKTAVSNNRVFITHGKNLEVVRQIKDILVYGNFTPVVAAEIETVSKPVPDKVMDEMRSCYAGIIHVGKEIKLIDSEGKEHIFANQNVLIEIGAAMALYEGRFILLVERGTTLPSNLQGLYEVRYEGDKLDHEATMKLLKAFNEFKK
jgi:predicted nucleotide-binding protein